MRVAKTIKNVTNGDAARASSSDEVAPVAARTFRVDTGHPQHASLLAPRSAPVEPASAPISAPTDRKADWGDNANADTGNASRSANRERLESDDRLRAMVAREETWLSLHAVELIRRLQSWAEDLDEREAKLNARTACFEQRERQWRLQQQIHESELAESQRALVEQQEMLKAAARRLAFEQ